MLKAMTRLFSVAILLMGLSLTAASPAAASVAQERTAKPAAECVTAAQGSSDMVPMFEINPCADLDFSQVNDCTSGTCYSYCWDVVHPYTYYWCESQKKNVRHHNWLTYRTGTRMPSGCTGSVAAA